MTNKIKTQNGIYEYESIELYHGRKYLDLKVAKENLLDFHSILNKEKIEFGIIYGTLLGAVREKGFIVHDEDIDLYIKDVDKDNFLSLLFKLKQIGFNVARYDGSLISLIRNNDYIDVYFFKKNIFNKWICNGHVIESQYLDNYNKIDFLGETFNIPSNHIMFLESCYGKSWNIPKKNSPADVHKGFSKIIFVIKSYLPKSTIIILKKIRNKIRGI